MKETLHSLTCRSCSQVNPIDAKFCKNCGGPLANICSNCSTLNDDDAKFCKNCGTALEVVATPEETRLSLLQQSAPAGLQEKIRASSSELEGERKPVTILFADIVGSTSIAEKLDPEIWREVVEGAHKRVGEAIYRYEGTIAQLLGDGVLAFFGAPITHEDDPIRAVRAALDIQEAIQDYEHDLKDLLETFQMRVGINTGEVVIGNIGTDMHLEYLALGDAVNIAARLQSVADPGKVLLSGSCAHLIGDRFELRSLVEITVKGKEEPVETYEIAGLKAPEEIGRTVQAYQTPYVDREDEVKALRSSLLKLCEGQGQIVSLVGEAGIGKTRLLEEVRENLCEKERDFKTEIMPPSSIRWLEGRALSYGGSLSYWTISHLLLSDLGLSDGASQVKIKVALRQRMKELFSEEQSGEVMPYVANLLGIPLEGGAKERIESLDGGTLKKETHRALGEYFTQVAGKNRTVLLFEDMHWADPSSMEVLEGLLSLTDHVPLMILMLMRIERDHGSWDLRMKVEKDFHHRYTDIHLRRLSEKDSIALVENLLGSSELPEEISEPILTRAEGNPFYLEEVVRHMIEECMILQDEGGWGATEAMREIGIPDTLQGVLLARIDRLEEDVRHTLQMASVIGKSFLYRILEAISEAERELDAHLSQLQRLDLVREKTRIPELEYIFRQTLTQEAAYNSLLHKRRKDFHLKVGEALEGLFPERVDDFLGLLAYHFEAAEAHDEAVDYLIKAGDKARLAYANQEAIQYYERSIKILKEQEKYSLAARTVMKLGLTYHNDFDFKGARQAFDESFSLRERALADRPDILPPSPHPYRGSLIAEPPTLDPTISADRFSGIIIRNLFGGLVESGAAWDILPDVARSWEISDDGLTYTFHLRGDVFWTDGVQVKAEDFVFSLRRALDPSIGSPRSKAGIGDWLKSAKAYRRGDLSDPEQVGVRAIGDLTLEMELERPVSFFLQTLSDYYPVPKHVVEEHGDAWTHPDNIVTNGPFSLETYQPSETITLVRNPKYHGRFSGNLERVELRLDLGTLSETLKIYEANEVDGVYLEVDTYHARQAHGEEYITESESTVVCVAFDSSQPPFNDLKVRQAFIMAVDRERLASEILDGMHDPGTGGFIPRITPGHSPDIGLPYDPDQARQLLTQAGYPGGRGFPNTKIIRPQIGPGLDFLQDQWLSNLNVEIAIETMKWKSVYDWFFRGNLRYMGVSGFTDPEMDVPVRLLVPEWKDDRFEKIMEQVQKSTSQHEWVRLCQEADKIVIEEAVIMPIFYLRLHYLVKPWLKIPPGQFGTYNYKNYIIEPH